MRNPEVSKKIIDMSVRMEKEMGDGSLHPGLINHMASQFFSFILIAKQQT